MPSRKIPDLREIWEVANRSRMDIAELRGMLTMHFRDGEHHHPPCAPAAGIQKTLLTAVGAALLALASALGCLVMELIRSGHA